MENPKMDQLTEKQLAEYSAKIRKTGLIYLPSLPPFIKPVKIRQLLSKYGEINRIYLAPEDSKIAARRKKYGGSGRTNFTEGWVEFVDKKVAKSVAAMLNGTCIGGKKRSRFHDDIWNLKYLPGFKWDGLTEQIAYELKVREQKMKQEAALAKRRTRHTRRTLARQR